MHAYAKKVVLLRKKVMSVYVHHHHDKDLDWSYGWCTHWVH